MQDHHDWTFSVPVLAIVHGVNKRLVRSFLEQATEYNWNVEFYDSVAAVLAAHRAGRENVASAASSVSALHEWGGRDSVPFHVMAVETGPGDAAASLAYVGGNPRGGGISVASFGVDCRDSELEWCAKDWLMEEDPRRKWSDRKFGELATRSRSVRFFSIVVLSDSDGRVSFNVDSIDRRPGGFAHAVVVRPLDANGKSAGKGFRLPLRPRATLEREINATRPRDGILTYHYNKDGLAGPREFRAIGWNTEAVHLHPGLWRAVVDGGGYLVRLTGDLHWRMPLDATRRIFLSYVREDSPVVHQLAAQLEAAGFSIWLDKANLVGGQRWKRAIRNAISDGAAMVACFSNSYLSRDKTYMNEELVWAVEEIRKRPSDRTWFIPVRLDPCDIPDRDIGGGETLRDIQTIDMFPTLEDGLGNLVAALSHLRS